jgi:NAD(P)-dependent dehydrogenase (short-subunit alcohol dehydrogenase family)
MKEFKDKVAVITGAASGIGFGIAERCAREGMKVVLAGINGTNLAKAAVELKTTGATVLSIPTDVSKSDEVEALAQKTFETFGAAHLLCNNAGVGAGSTIWESTLADWEWVMGVNLLGVVHGLRAFVPRMMEQDVECHIVNTASMIGLLSGPGLGIYRVTKQGIVTLSETLHHELIQRGSKIKVSVLCPGWVRTRIPDAERNRPIALQNTTIDKAVRCDAKAERIARLQARIIRRAVERGLTPGQVADCVFTALREERFYILTHEEAKSLLQTRIEDLLQDRNPTNTFIQVT